VDKKNFLFFFCSLSFFPFTLTFRFGSVRFGSVRFGSVRFGSVRFGSVRFGSVRFGSVRFGSVRFGSVRLRFVCVSFAFRFLSVFYILHELFVLFIFSFVLFRKCRVGSSANIETSGRAGIYRFNVASFPTTFSFGVVCYLL
jgi:hypothetical protein